MNLYLTGFMGSGKTTVGRRLAARLDWRFVDLDEEIERREGASVRDLFARHGETYFRALEERLLAEAAGGDEQVVATGGGTLALPENLALAERTGLVVWLHPAFATIVDRIGALGKENRPLFADETRALALYRDRLPAYARSDITLEIGRDESVEEVAERLLARVRERACAT